MPQIAVVIFDLDWVRIKWITWKLLKKIKTVLRNHSWVIIIWLMLEINFSQFQECKVMLRDTIRTQRVKKWPDTNRLAMICSTKPKGSNCSLEKWAVTAFCFARLCMGPYHNATRWMLYHFCFVLYNEKSTRSKYFSVLQWRDRYFEEASSLNILNGQIKLYLQQDSAVFASVFKLFY